ncbi:probable protein phosphatase 2C 8 [Camellia sinensis]|uniref:probable protein phosphatase 2C 8 n=1 Tax=Camellia sinensis TaxID=4442 RepID=UPI001036B414|nr:probable protein phosphatase 2C 8 [Camellia sinensis]
MEDTLRVELGLLTRYSRDFNFFGVYDGYGGSHVAHTCRDQLHGLLMGVEKMDKEVSDCGRAAASHSAAALSEVTIGSTAVVGEEEIVVANCGNSRVVLSRGGVVISLSDDHKPNRPDELERIKGAGGKVINWNGHRVLATLL